MSISLQVAIFIDNVKVPIYLFISSRTKASYSSIRIDPCLKTLQLREYIDDTEDYINIQVTNWNWDIKFELIDPVKWVEIHICCSKHTSCSFLQLDNHRNQLIQVSCYVYISIRLLPCISLLSYFLVTELCREFLSR